MSKYFNEEIKTTLSGKIDWLRQTSGYDKEQKIKEVRYLREILGDVRLSGKVINEFINLFHTSGGKYDVRTNTETIEGLYEICAKFPNLTSQAVKELANRYIKDLFEEYSLIELLEEMIKSNGATDEVFEKYLSIIDKAAEEQQERYKEEANKLDQYKEEYSDIECSLDYIDYLKALVIREHIPVESIINSMPEKDLISKDVEQLSKLSKQTRIYMGVGIPASYAITRVYAKEKKLSSIPEQPTYTINTGKSEIPTTFTKQSYIESIIKHQQKVK